MSASILKSRVQNLLLLAFVIALLVTITEIAVRLVFRDITTTADNRSYFALKWTAANVRLNSLRFREREPRRPKPPGVYRIAFIGDSFVFGQGMPEVARMSNLLEKELRSRVDRTEVLNFGNPGNNTLNEVHVLEQVLSGYEPDFVLLQWHSNDVNNNFERERTHYTPPGSSLINRATLWMRNRSALYFLIGRAWHQLRVASGDTDQADLKRRIGDPASPEWKAADATMRRFFKLSLENHVPLGVVLVPNMALLEPRDYELSYLNERVLKICTEESVDCIDLLPAFQAALSSGKSMRLLWVNQFDSHMGIAANAVAAERLFEHFGAAWVASARSRDGRQGPVPES